METKSGIKIPDVLSSQLQKTKSFKAAWDVLRPGCQRDYVQRIEKAVTTEQRQSKLERIIQLTKEYADKHPDKYKGRKPVKK